MAEGTSYRIKFTEAVKAMQGAMQGAIKQDSPIEKTLKNILHEATKEREVSSDLREQIYKAVEAHLSDMHAHGGDKYQSLACELDEANKVIAEINKCDHAWSVGRRDGIKNLVSHIAKYQEEKGEEAKDISLNMDDIGRLNENFNVDTISIYTQTIALGLNDEEQEKVKVDVQAQKVEPQARVKEKTEQHGKPPPGRRPSFTAPTKPPPPPPQVGDKRSLPAEVDSPEAEGDSPAKVAKTARDHLEHNNPSKASLAVRPPQGRPPANRSPRGSDRSGRY